MGTNDREQKLAVVCGMLCTMDIQKKFTDLLVEVEAAGEIARHYFDSDETTNEIKSDGSVVTHVDQEIEARLTDFIRREFPDDAIIGEEGAGCQGTSSFVWHIDPIDGTDNFLREIPFTAISVARLGDGPEGSFGIVHNPITRRTFSSYMEGGVYENSRSHVVNSDMLGGRAIISVATGKEAWMKTAKYNLMKALGEALGRGTALNCAALELGYVAANRIDGVLILGLKTYDYAAGLYLVRAAGGVIYVFRDGRWQLYSGAIKALCDQHGEFMFAAHAGVADQALAIIGDPQAWAD